MTRVALLCGGVGGARMARGFAAVLGPDLTAIVNVGDDDEIYGLHVSADLDTVVYTLAGREGPHGWGVTGDGFAVMEHLGAFGVDTTFRLGDADLALSLYRTMSLDAGLLLSEVTARIAAALGVTAGVLPASDDPVRTILRTSAGGTLAFQEYFVLRGQRDEVVGVHFEGASDAEPAPGVLDAIRDAAVVVVAPSNPPLSIWPILAVTGMRRAVSAAERVIAVSPLFGGRPLKGPADRVMAGLGLPPGNAGVLAAYDGLLTDLVVDLGDGGDVALGGDVAVHAVDTRIALPDAAARFAEYLLGLM